MINAISLVWFPYYYVDPAVYCCPLYSATWHSDPVCLSSFSVLFLWDEIFWDVNSYLCTLVIIGIYPCTCLNYYHSTHKHKQCITMCFWDQLVNFCHISLPQHYSPTVPHKTWRERWSWHQRISRISSWMSLSSESLMKWCQRWTSYKPYVEAGLAQVANWRVRLSFFKSQWVGSKAYSGL